MSTARQKGTIFSIHSPGNAALTSVFAANADWRFAAPMQRRCSRTAAMLQCANLPPQHRYLRLDLPDDYP
jgi:hypothetical protein